MKKQNNSSERPLLQAACRCARVYAPGDCREPRNIMGALWDAYEVGRSI